MASGRRRVGSGRMALGSRWVLAVLFGCIIGGCWVLSVLLGCIIGGCWVLAVLLGCIIGGWCWVTPPLEHISPASVAAKARLGYFCIDPWLLCVRNLYSLACVLICTSSRAPVHGEIRGLRDMLRR